MLSLFRKLSLNKKNIEEKKELGNIGENIAVKFLKKKNFHILARNWRHKNDEIDIICSDGDILVFVEVKLRNNKALVGGYYAVTQKKKMALKRAINEFLKNLNPPPLTHRFDVIEISYDKETKSSEIFHYENVEI